MNWNGSKKLLASNILRRFARIRLETACMLESGSVNHSEVMFRIGLSQAFYQRRRGGGAPI
jgi:hypothetical protein